MKNSLKIRYANKNDVNLLYDFIKQFAKYEKLIDDVTATEDLLLENLFLKKYAEAIIVELNEIPVGFAIFHDSFSGFLGKPNIYIEDIYVREKYRRTGIGKQIISFIMEIAQKRKCGRVEWCTLDWNSNAIDFYKSTGAKLMDDLLIFRLEVNNPKNC